MGEVRAQNMAAVDPESIVDYYRLLENHRLLLVS